MARLRPSYSTRCDLPPNDEDEDEEEDEDEDDQEIEVADPY